MRAIAAGLLGVGLGLVSRPALASEAAPLIVFSGSSEAAGAQRAVTAALGELARREGTALVDLSPEPEPAPTASLELGRGVAAYRAFDFERALTHFDAAVDEAAATGAAGLSVSELSDLLVYRGLSRAGAGDDAGAWDEFLRAAAIDPTRRLDPVRFPPSVIERFRRATDAVSAEAPVELTVAVEPGCAVAIDARDLGSARSAMLRPGEHYLRVVCPGKERYATRVALLSVPQTITPKLVAPERPNLEAALAVARRRGLRRVLFAALSQDGAGATVTLKLATADGKLLGSTSAAVGEPATAGASVAAAFDRMLAAAAPVSIVAPPSLPEPAPWYRRPWVWGVAGAAVTAIVLAPLVFDDPPPSRFEVGLDGTLPR